MSDWSTGPAVFGRPRAVFLRFAPWAIFQNNHPHDLMWPVSHLYGKGIAEACGWEAKILDLHVEDLDADGLVSKLAKLQPDLLLIDTMTPTMAYARDIASRLKDTLPDLPIWGVGQHATEQPEDLLYPGSPMAGVLLGEFEANLAELLASRGERPLDGSAVLGADGKPLLRGGKKEVHDLDALPPIDPSGLHLDRYRMRSIHVPRFGRMRWGYMLTSRGCPFPCTFCSATLRQSYGRKFRGHSAERVVADMVRLHLDHGIDAFYTIDDVFSLDKSRVEEICRRLLQHNLPIAWTIQTRGDLIDKPILKLMKRAGCCGVKMGIESGVPRILKLIRKNATREQLLQAARDTQEAGLSLTTYYMVGHPTETRHEMEQTFQFAREVASDMVQMAFHTPYPGSATYEMYKDHVDDLSELSHYETQHVNLSEVDSATLERLQRSFYLRYYFRPPQLLRYLRRRAIYRLTDPTEWQLGLMSLKYLLGNRGRTQSSANAPKPRSAPEAPSSAERSVDGGPEA
jgi:anaerobic magnesium-protoporphyrin IX monomethyl ester cyclase